MKTRKHSLACVKKTAQHFLALFLRWCALAISRHDGLTIRTGLLEPIGQHHITDLTHVLSQLGRWRDDLHALWQEFEAGESPDAIFARSIDRVQPVMLNIWADGGTWAEYGVTWDQLDSRVGQRVARGAPRLWDWVAARARAWFGSAA